MYFFIFFLFQKENEAKEKETLSNALLLGSNPQLAIFLLPRSLRSRSRDGKSLAPCGNERGFMKTLFLQKKTSSFGNPALKNER